MQGPGRGTLGFPFAATHDEPAAAVGDTDPAGGLDGFERRTGMPFLFSSVVFLFLSHGFLWIRGPPSHDFHTGYIHWIYLFVQHTVGIRKL
jgi:hypothetical protein